MITAPLDPNLVQRDSEFPSIKGCTTQGYRLQGCTRETCGLEEGL
jgi:hypothetical protein